MDLAGELARFEAEVVSTIKVPDGAATAANGALHPPASPAVKPPGPPPPLAAAGPVLRPPGPPPAPSLSRPAGPPPALVARPSGRPPPIAPAAPSAAFAAPPAAAQPAYDYGGYPQASGYDMQMQAGYGQQDAYAQAYASSQQAYYAAPSTSAAARPHMNLFDQGALDALRESILAEPKDSKNKKKKKVIKEGATMRVAGGDVWYDDTLDSWPKNDFRIFVGNLGPEVTDDVLAKAFQGFPTYAKCRVIKDNKLQKSKGYGFVSFTDAVEGAKALRQMNSTYIGNRPCKLKKSAHDTRTAPEDKKKRKAMLVNPLDRVTHKRMR